jgi:tetratricopeptide (TPR) repeat protein
MTTEPIDGAAALERASVLCSLGRFDDAAGRLRTILATDPHNEDGLCLMAQALFGLGAYDQSLRTSLIAISENPENEWPHRVASLALSALGRHGEAQAMGREAIRLAPNSAQGYINLAQILADSPSGLGEARAAAERAVVLAPHDPDSHIAVGVVASAGARTEDARDAFHRALALEPDNHIAHNELARLQLTRTKFDNADALVQAAGGFADALRANPRAAVSRHNLDLVLHHFLAQIAYVIFLVAWLGRVLAGSVETNPFRFVPALILAFPFFFAVRFVSGLSPQLRGHLRHVLRGPLTATAVLCDAIAAAGLIVGAAFQGVTFTAFAYAVGLSALAGVILWLQGRRLAGPPVRGRVAVRSLRARGRSAGSPGTGLFRALWWLATAVLILITQIVFGPLPTVMSSTEGLLRVATAIGCVTLVYAIYRRRK